MIISFSGVDGAGKSTQADYVKGILEDRGLSVCYIHMISWSLTNRIGKMLQKIGVNISASPLGDSFPLKKTRFFGGRLLRKMLLVFDSIRFHFFSIYNTEIRNQVLICDRFFYDLVVQGVYTGVITDKFEKFYTKIIPRPTIAILLDVSSEIAQRRESEHTLNYYQIKRELYLRSASLWGMTIIGEKEMSKTRREIEEIIRSYLPKE